MRRAFVAGAAGALVLALLSGFSLLPLSVQTARVRWTAIKTGTTVSGSLGPSFGGSSDGTGTVSFGPAAWRMAGISCQRSGYCLNNDGGVTELIATVTHEDGGIDCQCDLSSCNATTTSASSSCTCAGGITELGGATWTVGLISAASVVATNPDGGATATYATLLCGIDLFR